jgi:Uma2 family endonuclease
VLKLAMALDAHAVAAGGEVLVAPVDVVLDERRPVVLQPDLLYLAPEQMILAVDRVYGAPALVVEILSPRPRIGDLDERVALFVRHGVREIWVYDQQARALDVLQCADARVASRVRIYDGPIKSAVLPAFGRSMAEIVGQR